MQRSFLSKVIVFLTMTVMLMLVGCKNNFTVESYEESFDESNVDVLIGDEVIYGESFSFNQLYASNARSAGIPDEYLDAMVYFSVCPTNFENLQLINDTLGFLNPIEMNKEILQTCDAETLIFDEEKLEQNLAENPEDAIQYGIKYYYIESKKTVNELKDILEGFEIIEEFSVPNDEYQEQIAEENAERGILTKYTICGNINYEVSKVTLPAYGITVKRGLNKYSTNTNGYFSLGTSRDILGLCWLWVDYENKACKLSNILNVTASTLVKVDWPSKLSNVTIKASAGYANTKMAVCSELLARYDDEVKRHLNIPCARVWTVQSGNGTSSAPCFGGLLPDILLTGCDSYDSGMLQLLHHEYTHFLHNKYTGNKNNFWTNVVLSETGCTISNKAIEIVNKILGTSYSTSYVSFYDFKNQYVTFTENLAEWYSYLGRARGNYGRKINLNETGDTERDSSTFKNIHIFTNLVKSGFSANVILDLIDKYNVITFQELYDALVKDYPNKKSVIQNVFKTYYVSYGNEINY